MPRDFATVIIGAGVTGVALARSLALAGQDRVAVIDKEPAVAAHTSSRNSGVAHAGYNPKPGTLKASLCVEGNRRLREFCRTHRVPLLEGGILIVAREEAEVSRLEALRAQGEANGVPGLSVLDGKDIARVEPNAAGLAALHAPTGASFDAAAYVRALAKEAREAGVAFLLGRKVEAIEPTGSGFTLRAGDDRIRADRLVNCAGLHADRIAHSLGAGRDLAIVPVRGEYRRVRPERSDIVRSMVYPVPNPEFPFLGVHWTKTGQGEVIVGPNAIPALGREAYSWRESSFSGLLDLAREPRAWRLLAQPGFASLLWQQLQTSLSPARFAAAARSLVPSARAEDMLPGPSGIRAQLVDGRGRMVEDLLVEEQGSALHVLNVVSPGLTCAIAFADELRDRLR